MDVTPVTQLLLQQIGLDHDTIGETSIVLGVQARMQTLRLTNFVDYVDRVSADPKELQSLTEEVIVPETWFFRGLDQLRYMAKVASQWQMASPVLPLRVLSVPCSSGEEPYSIYMMLRHFGLESSQIRIVAVDISQRSIDRAQQGVFTEFSFREREPLCDILRHRFFEGDATLTVRSEVRDAVQFRQGNLISPTLLSETGEFDLIFCRNVLIYFDQRSRKRALQALKRLLAPSGYLFGGHAEPLSMFDPQLKSVGPIGAFAYQRANVAAVTNIKKPSPLFTRNPETKSPPPLPTFKSAFAPSAPAQTASLIVANSKTSRDLLGDAEQAADSGRLSDARSMCQQHLQQHGPTAPAFCLMGVIHQAAGELSDAEKSFQKALYLDPAHKDSLWHLTLLAEQRGDQHAVETLRRRLARVVSDGDPS